MYALQTSIVGFNKFSSKEFRSHMANLVKIGNSRYLVDVGYGADGPSRPLPLVSGQVLDGLPGQQLILENKGLPQHTDPGQRSGCIHSEGIPGCGWKSTTS